MKPFYQEDLIEAGLDEAGRGCLAGPVFAAAVILPKDFEHPYLTDSKQLTEKQRYALRDEIEQTAISYAVASLSNEEIDQLNILKASVAAMHKAVEKLSVKPEFLIIDGNYFRKYQALKHKTIVKGDAQYYSIAAASILAKTYRDDFMNELHQQFPQYFWNKNKGYPTKQHRDAIKEFGASPFHRKTFKLLPDTTLLNLK